MTELKCKKAVYRRWKQGWTAKEECKNIAWPCSDGVRKAKTQMELRLSRDVTGNKVSFCLCINHKRLSKEKVGLFLNGVSDLVTADTGVAEALSAAFSSVFIKKVSQATVLRGVVQGGELPAVSEDEGRDRLRDLSPDKLMRPDGLHPRVLKELADVLKRPLSNIFERSQRARKVPDDWRKANVAPKFKKGQKNNLGNYRLVGLTFVPGKLVTDIN